MWSAPCDLAEQTAREKGGCVMLGSIIHNAHVVRELEQLGGRSCEQPGGDPPRRIRSSSAPTASASRCLDTLEAVGVRCVDATCPNVQRIQQLVAQADGEGRTPIIIGEEHHPEVHGRGQLVQRGHVIFEDAGKTAEMAGFRPGKSPVSADCGGSDHLHPVALGNFFKNFEKRVYKREII